MSQIQFLDAPLSMLAMSKRWDVISGVTPMRSDSAERGAKFIKTYIRSTIAQERLDSLAILSLDTNKLIDMFG